MARRTVESRQVRRINHEHGEPTTDIPYNEAHERAASVAVAAEALVEHIDSEFPEDQES